MHSDFGYFEEAALGKAYDAKLLKRLLPFARPYKVLLIWSIALVMLITGLDLALPYITKHAIDEYIVPKIDRVVNASAGGQESRGRFLRTNLADPHKRAVAQKYPALFKVEGNTALISYDALSKIEKKDLAVLRRTDIFGLTVISAIFLGLVVIDFVLNFVQKILMEFTGHRMMHDLRMQLFSHIQDLAVAFFTRNPVARLVTRTTNDVQNMHELFTSVIALVFKDFFLLIGIAGVMLVLNWKLALVSFMVLPIVFYASMNFSKRARDIFRVLRIKIAEINTRFSETIDGIRIVQLFNREISNYQRFKRLNRENYLAGMQQIRVLAVFMPLIELLAVVAVALVIFYGGSQVISDNLSLGALVAFISYIRMFFRPIRDLAEKYNILQNALASAERIFLILDTDSRLPPNVAPHPQEISKIDRIDEIKLDHVNFSYVEGEPVLRDVSFSINAGETVAVVGPTGAGKTSLVNLIARFYDPASGRVLVNGLDLRNMDTYDFRSKIALVMQDPFLFSSTIRENIFDGTAAFSEADMQAIIAAANCTELINRLPAGWDTVLSEGGASISSGERQLISIARAFARQPQLILFDEATSYIDSQTEAHIQKALTNLMENKTSLIVAHRLSTVRHADRIIVLNRGRVIESGNHSELMRKKGFYFKLNQLQK